MFGEAVRVDSFSKYFKNMQNGKYSKADNREIKKKKTDYYLK
jgi:hypothetical protein